MTATNETLKHHPYFSEYPINSDITVVVGKKGIGKSVETKKELLVCLMCIEPPAPTGIIVFDVCDEHSTLSAIALNDIKQFHTVEIRRIRPYREDGRKLTLDEIKENLIFVLDNLSNVILCIEDICNYVRVEDYNDLVAAISRAQSNGVKIITHLQGITAISSPKILKKLNVIRMHKTYDTVCRRREKLGDKYEMLRIAELIVDRKYRGVTVDKRVVIEPNVRFFLYCNFDTQKIVGDFTSIDIEFAIMEYVNENKELVNQMLKCTDERGKLVYWSQTLVKTMQFIARL